MPIGIWRKGHCETPGTIPQDKGETQQTMAISHPCWSLRYRSEVILDILAPENSVECSCQE